jgi:hypothetical protein
VDVREITVVTAQVASVGEVEPGGEERGGNERRTIFLCAGAIMGGRLEKAKRSKLACGLNAPFSIIVRKTNHYPLNGNRVIKQV